MRQQGSNQRRPRGRSNRKPQLSPRSQTYDSNGPDVRVRGNAHQVYEKYLNLARDAASSGDRIGAESYYQFAEHYFRLLNDTTDPQRGVDFQRGGQRDRFGQPLPRDRDGQPYPSEGDGPGRQAAGQQGRGDQGEARRANGQGHDQLPPTGGSDVPPGDQERAVGQADAAEAQGGEQPPVAEAVPAQGEAKPDAEPESAAPPKRRPGRPRRRPSNGAEASVEAAGDESANDKAEKADSEPASA